MDSSVIQEIADQLGLAADAAGSFIQEHIPEFAAMKAMQTIIPLIVIWALLGIGIIVTLVAAIVFARQRKVDMDRKDQGKHPRYSRNCASMDCEDYPSFTVFVFAGIVSAALLVISVIATVNTMGDFIGWLQYPDAMAIQLALDAVHG